MNKTEPIDHDRLFKELLETFFTEFVALFFPDAYREIDLTHLTFLQQEVFTDVTAGDKHVVDLLAETKLRDENGLVLIHVENQAYFQQDFSERMFIYFTRLYQKFRRKILPIVIFSYDVGHDEPDCFQIGFPFLEVLKFHFYKLELKKRNWREYIESDNPVAAALLSKMGYQPAEKVQVKLEFMRMLTRLRLDPARMTLLTGFFETYLKLNSNEEKILENEVQKLDAQEVRKMMELTTSWQEKGRAEGRLDEKKEIARNMLLEGLATSLVVKMTGLSEAEIGKLQQELESSNH
jgi:predicted transposase/invertase (TIGR01784 family)